MKTSCLTTETLPSSSRSICNKERTRRTKKILKVRFHDDDGGGCFGCVDEKEEEKKKGEEEDKRKRRRRKMKRRRCMGMRRGGRGAG
jgi:hypothetical protein